MLSDGAPGRPPGWTPPPCTVHIEEITSDKPAWDPGIQVGWSSAGRWRTRLHGQEGARSGAYMLGYSEPPGLQQVYQ